jgi:XrtJ-associated TM-motif-TM protein
MWKKIAMAGVVLALLSPNVWAQGGCVDSPENPTAVLMLVGAAGAFAVRVRRR